MRRRCIFFQAWTLTSRNRGDIHDREFGTRPSTWKGKHWHGKAATAFPARLFGKRATSTGGYRRSATHRATASSGSGTSTLVVWAGPDVSVDVIVSHRLRTAWRAADRNPRAKLRSRSPSRWAVQMPTRRRRSANRIPRLAPGPRLARAFSYSDRPSGLHT